MRDISIDTRGLSFSIQVIGVVLIIGALWSVWMPVQKNIAGAKESVGLTAAVEERGVDDDSVQIAIPKEYGKHIRVDVEHMEVALLEGEHTLEILNIIWVPGSDSSDVVSSGMYTVDKKTKAELSTITMVRFPYLVQFGDHFAFHGTPTDGDGVALPESFAGGRIELESADAEKIYNFAEAGMPIYVVADNHQDVSENKKEDVLLSYEDLPAASAQAYLIGDASTGEVFLEKGADERYPIASITKLVTAAVATDVIGHGAFVRAQDGEQYTLSDLYYPLLLRSDNKVADRIAMHAGEQYFMANMNAYVQALGMYKSSFSDASGLSPKNISTANDLLLLAQHLYAEKDFLLGISHEEDMTITSVDGNEWHVANQNKLASDPHFRGGKLGYTDEAGQTALSIFSIPFGDSTRPIVVVVLNSKDWKQDTRTLLKWVVEGAE